MVETLGWIPRNPSAATAVISCKHRLVAIRRERGKKIGIGPKEMETGRTRDKEQGGERENSAANPGFVVPSLFHIFQKHTRTQKEEMDLIREEEKNSLNRFFKLCFKLTTLISPYTLLQPYPPTLSPCLMPQHHTHTYTHTNKSQR